MLDVITLLFSAYRRKNPYSGRFQFTAFSPAPVKDYIRYPSPSEEDISVTSSDSLNAALRQYLTGYQDLSLRSACEPWGKGSIAIELVDQAVFHVFLSWEPSGKPVFLRINVLGQGEKVSQLAYRISQPRRGKAVWLKLSYKSAAAIPAIRIYDMGKCERACISSCTSTFRSGWLEYPLLACKSPSLNASDNCDTREG